MILNVLPRELHMPSSIRISLSLLLLACQSHLAGLNNSDAQAPRMQLSRTPDGGTQPHAVGDTDRCLHLLYFKVDPKAERPVLRLLDESDEQGQCRSNRVSAFWRRGHS